MKPEIWQDENVGDLTRDARLLLIGLITMADDEGRLRALPTLVLGHVFPYDEVSPARLKRWIAEIETAGLVLSYVADGKPYIAFRHWARHQKPNRPSPSVLPEPPDPKVVSDNALPDQGRVTNNSVSDHGKDTEDSVPRAQARGSEPRSDPDPFPVQFSAYLQELDHVADNRGKSLNVAAAVKACEEFAACDLAREAKRFRHFYIDGDGENRRMKDVAGAWRSWLENAPAARADRKPSRAKATKSAVKDLSPYTGVEAAT